jgi:hypothetical protein
MKYRIFVGVAFVASCAAPIEQPKSSTVPPSSIQTFVDVTSNGSAATIELRWSSQSDTTQALVLGPDDRLRARAADAAPRDLAFVENKYFGLVPTLTSTVTISLVQPRGELDTEVKLPPSFVVNAPPGPVTRSQPIVLGWTPWQGGVRVTVTGPCLPLAIERRITQDTGGFTLSPGDFGNVVAACTLTVVVTRSDTFYQATPIRTNGLVHQVRTINVETTP